MEPRRRLSQRKAEKIAAAVAAVKAEEEAAGAVFFR